MDSYSGSELLGPLSASPSDPLRGREGEGEGEMGEGWRGEGGRGREERRRKGRRKKGGRVRQIEEDRWGKRKIEKLACDHKRRLKSNLPVWFFNTIPHSL